jgi:transcription elongation factor GreA
VTETRADNVTWLTQEAYDRLKAELDHLSGPGRIEIAQKIEAAREEGDLRENGGYHAAKEEQGKIEGRILQLQCIL